MGKNYSRLTFQERLVIEKLYKDDMNTIELELLAKKLKRNRSTVIREIQKNTTDGKQYRAIQAQERAKAEQEKRLDKIDELSQRRKAEIKKILLENPCLTNQQIAEKVGYSKTTVSKYIKELLKDILKEEKL